jgi:hypothetical protein
VNRAPLGWALYGVKLLEQGCEQRLGHLMYPHLTGDVLNRDAHAFAAGGIVAEFRPAHLVGVSRWDLSDVSDIRSLSLRREEHISLGDDTPNT